MTKKKILLIIRTAPYGNSGARDAIDFILTAAAYDQDISVIYQGDGVFQTLKEQDPTALPMKNTSSMISAFEMYDIEDIYCDSNSLTERNIPKDQLMIDCEFINTVKISKLIETADAVLTF